MARYLNNGPRKFYYDEIKKPNSLESDVDNFYNNFLNYYFPNEQAYGIEQESRTLQELGQKKKTDFTVRYIRRPDAKKVVVLEAKRREYETMDSEWRGGLDQAIKYIKLIRTEERQDPDLPVYIIVAIGTRLRAYVHGRGDSDASDFHLHSGTEQPLELEQDEEKVHEIFMELNRLTHD